MKSSYSHVLADFSVTGICATGKWPNYFIVSESLLLLLLRIWLELSATFGTMLLQIFLAITPSTFDNIWPISSESKAIIVKQSLVLFEYFVISLYIIYYIYTINNQIGLKTPVV